MRKNFSIKYIFFLSLLIIFSNFVFSACNGSIDYFVPAVVGENGGLIKVNIRAIDGSGHVFVDTIPNVGTMTEDSLTDAVAYVSSRASSDKCDFLVSFKTNTGGVDGPSGGAAMSVAIYSLVEGMKPRSDTIITGTIDPFGNVGPVGGLYEKGKSAAQNGAHYFITPTENFFEYSLLKNLQKTYPITILQTDKIDDIYNFVFYNESFNSSTFTKRKPPEIDSYVMVGSSEAKNKYESFKEIAQNTVNRADAEVQKISAKNDEPEVAEVYKAEILRQNAIIDKGYYFSAANEAFLDYIDLVTLNSISGDNTKNIYATQKADIKDCLNGIGTADKTMANYEWTIGADLRKAWAEDKLDKSQIKSEDIASSDEFLIQLHEIMYAKAWCNIAQELLKSADKSDKNSKPIDESAWKTIAQKQLAEAKKQTSLSDDLKDRLNVAEQSCDNGKYGACAYDSVYVLAMSTNTNRTNVASEYKDLENKPFESFWANIYKSQAAFLYAQNETPAAYKTIYYAALLEELNSDLSTLAKENISTSTKNNASDKGFCFSPALALFLISYLAIKRYGLKNPGNS